MVTTYRGRLSRRAQDCRSDHGMVERTGSCPSSFLPAEASPEEAGPGDDDAKIAVGTRGRWEAERAVGGGGRWTTKAAVAAHARAQGAAAATDASTMDGRGGRRGVVAAMSDT